MSIGAEVQVCWGKPEDGSVSFSAFSPGICYLEGITYVTNFCRNKEAFFLHICTTPNMAGPHPSFLGTTIK